MSLAASESSSLVFTQAPKEVHEMTMHKITSGGQVQWEEGVLHFYHDTKGKLIMIPPSAYQQEKDKLPPICYAIKYPMKKIEEKTFPDLSPLMAMLEEEKGEVVHEGVKDSLTNQDIVGPRYFGAPPPSKGSKTFDYSENSFFKVKDVDIDPIIFIRFARPIQKLIDLPKFDPSEFYGKSTAFGLDIEIKPDYRSEISSELVAFDFNLFETKQNLMGQFDSEKLH